MRDSGHKPSRFAGLKKIGSSLLRLFGGDFPVFLLFLGITFLIWWSQTMSQSFEAQMKLPVEIVGIPDDVRVTTPATDHISVMLSGKGSALRKSGRRSGHSVLRLNSRSFTIGHGHAALSTQSLRDSVMARVHASVSIRSIEPDSLVFLFARQRSVMLPVEYEVVTESQDQFFLERVELRPDSVRAYVLMSDTVTHRALLQLGNVVLASDTIGLTVPLESAPDVLFDASEVRVQFISQQYTEKSVEVPVSGVNFPADITLKSFPSKAVLTFWVKMSEYDRVGAHDFRVVVDYNDIAGGSGVKAPLRVFSQPANVRNVRLQTRTVDYLMESKYF